MGKRNGDGKNRVASELPVEVLEFPLKPSVHRPNLKHGGYSLRELALTHWPVELLESYDARCEQIAELPHINWKVQQGEITQLVRMELVINICYAWVFRYGEISPRGETPPILNVLRDWERDLSDRYGELGLTIGISSGSESFADRLQRWTEARSLPDRIRAARKDGNG